MTRKQQIQSNIWKYYLATALTHFGFFTPIIQLFYLSNDLTIVKIALIGVIWNIVRIVLEVPSGILADKWGRKKVIIISSFFAILQLIVLVGFTDYWYFLIASVFSAVSYAFLSGSDTAFFYDTLKELKRQNEYEKLWARQHIYTQVPLMISFVLSGFLFKISDILPFQVSLLFLIGSFVVTFTFKEPKFYKLVKEANIFSHFKASLNHIFKNKFLKSILIFALVFAIGSDISYYYGQIYLNELALPVVLFGIVYMFKSLFWTIAANFASSIRKKISYKNMFAIQIISITILLYIMVITKNYIVGAICFFLLAIPDGFFRISRNCYVNDRTKSYNRATVESMFSFLTALTIVILEPLVGYLADLHSIKLPFLLIAILMTFYGIYYIFKGNKNI